MTGLKVEATELKYGPNTLLCFIDDTGHELLNDPVQKVFGLGGCCIVGRHFERIVRRPWMEVRRAVAGNPSTALHAAELKNLTSDQLAAIVSFFRRQSFARVGAVCSLDTELPANVAPLRAVGYTLWNRIAEVAAWQNPDSVALVLEHSERLQRSGIEEVFSHHGLVVNGKTVPLERCRMAKSVGEPALEVADFIVNAVGAQARHRLAARPGHAKNFDAVFRGLDDRLVSFLDIGRVTARPVNETKEPLAQKDTAG